MKLFTLVVAWTCAATIAVPCVHGQESNAAPEGTLRQTTFHPFFRRYPLSGNFPSMLAHQGLIMSLREELQVDVVDGNFEDRTTLGSSEDAYLWEAWTEGDDSIKIQLRRYQAHAEQPNRLGELTEPLWSLSIPVDYTADKLIPSVLAQVEPATRGKFLEVATICNLAGAPNRRVESSEVPAALTANLALMDIVSQTQAVRDAHRLMRTEGESPELLGVLVRGYAHLGLLTRAHWSYTREVFAARSLLIAERLVNRDPTQPLGRWHRAYAAALAGAHSFALSDLAWIQEQQGGELNYPAAWCRLISPVCQYDYDRLGAVAEEHPEVQQAAQVLRFEAAAAEDDAQLLIEVGRETLQAVPSDLGMYDTLANEGGLEFERFVARALPSAAASILLERCSSPSSLPEAVREFAAQEEAATKGLDDEEADDEEQQAPWKRSYGASPQKVRELAQLLRDQSGQAGSDGLPLRHLAYLIDEELFLIASQQVANASNATESDLGPLIDALLPLVQGHRYEPYISSYRFNSYTDAAARRAEMAKIPPGPTRWHMGSFRYAISYKATPERWKEFSSFNQPEHLAHDIDLAIPYWESKKDGYRKFIQDYEKISPHAPNLLLYKIRAYPDADVAQLREWEASAMGRSKVLYQLARRYRKKGLQDDAIRCLETSLAARSTYSAAKLLSDIYWSQNNYEKWQATLEKFIEQPSLNLSDSTAQSRLAYGLIELNRLDEALTYALQSAQPYSASGLKVAAICHEVREEYAEAEGWWRRLSEAYGGEVRFDWYLFCRRRNFGELDAARSMARDYAEEVHETTNLDILFSIALLEIMDGSEAKAVELLRKTIEGQEHPARLRNMMHLGILAIRSADADLRQQTTETLTTHLESNFDDNDLRCHLLKAINARLQGETIDDEGLRRLLGQLDKVSAEQRASPRFFIGEILASQNDDGRAVWFWDLAVGEKLAKNHPSVALAAFRRLNKQDVKPIAWNVATTEENPTEENSTDARPTNATPEDDDSTDDNNE